MTRYYFLSFAKWIRVDYYGALNVTSGSNAPEIESKYRRLARKYHQDKLMGLPQEQQKVRLPPTNREPIFNHDSLLSSSIWKLIKASSPPPHHATTHVAADRYTMCPAVATTPDRVVIAYRSTAAAVVVCPRP